MKNLIFLVGLFILLSVNISAQTVSDALRYSYLTNNGSARSTGVAGSMGAIGGDFGALNTNPAGIAGYRFSEIAFSPSFYFNQTSSSLNKGLGLKENKFGSAIDHLGLVIVRNGHEYNKWRQVNYVIGYNRIADFNKSFYFQGATKGTITDHWRENALRIVPDDLNDFGSGLAYEAGAIYDTDNDYIYESDFIKFPNAAVTKSQIANYTGSINELQFGVAGNYKDKLMIGASLGIPMLSYTERKNYNESDPANTNPTFEDLGYTEYVKTEGNGANLKIGAILKLHKSFRLGVSFQTPTLFEQEDTYETSLSYSYVENGKLNTLDKNSPQLGVYTYNLLTPMRAGLQFGSVLGKLGFIGGGLEYVNYADAQFDFNLDGTGNASDQAYQTQLNQDINKQYQATLNYNAGAEIAIDDFRLRGGIKLLGSPYANDNDLTKVFSAGAGYRSGRFFMDFALQHTRFDDGYIPYNTSSGEQQFVNNKYQLNRLVVTMGLKFGR